MSADRAGWAEVVRRHGGIAARSLAGARAAEVEAAALLGVVVADAAHVPALARLSAPQAVATLLWAEAGGSGAGAANAANELLATLKQAGTPAFVLNDGSIGNDEGEPGSVRIARKEADELLGAALSGQLEWELDPDFGYEIPVATPSLSDDRAMALAPRLAYAASGRVYDHASLVPRVKEERHAILAQIAGLDPAVVAASGWPVEPTGSSWRRAKQSR